MKTNLPGDWLFRAVPIFIGFVFVLIICGLIGFGYLGYKGFDSLKDCTPAVTSKDVAGEHQWSVGCKK